MKTRTCPKCGKVYTDYPVISRLDNKTEICSDCGLNEAMTSFIQFLEAHKNPIKRGE